MLPHSHREARSTTPITIANKPLRKEFSVGESELTSNESKFIHKITTTIITHTNNSKLNNRTNIHNNKIQKHNKHFHNNTSKN